jgi:hypothetical protein
MKRKDDRIMSTRPTTHSDTGVLDEAAAWLVGGGILTVALFPFALPLLLLTLAGLLPFLVPPLLVALVIAILTVPILVARRIGRWALRALRGSRRVEHRQVGGGAAYTLRFPPPL